MLAEAFGSESSVGCLLYSSLALSTYLQHEDEIVYGLVPVEEVVFRRPLVLLVVFQLLYDVWVLQQAQQNLF